MFSCVRILEQYPSCLELSVFHFVNTVLNETGYCRSRGRSSFCSNIGSIKLQARFVNEDSIKRKQSERTTCMYIFVCMQQPFLSGSHI